MGDRHVVFSVDDFDGERSYIGFAFKALSALRSRSTGQIGDLVELSIEERALGRAIGSTRIDPLRSPL